MDPEYKINIYVTSSMADKLQNDAWQFEIFKKNGDINTNRLLSMLITGYYAVYRNRLEQKQQELRKLLEDHGLSEQAAVSVSKEIVKIYSYTGQENVVPGKKRGSDRNTKCISLKPTKATIGIISEIIAETKKMKESPSQYYGRMFQAFLDLPAAERERILFHENADKLREAIRKNHVVTLSTTANPEVRFTVIPYKVAEGQNGLSNYLLCQGTSKEGRPAAYTLRLCRIIDLVDTREIAVLDKEVKTHLQQMEHYGAQFTIQDETPVIVRLTREGVRQYKRIYYGRPTCDAKDIEEHEDYTDYHFSRSRNQIFLYFRRFGKEAEIISPADEREKMAKFYTEAARMYDNT